MPENLEPKKKITLAELLQIFGINRSTLSLKIRSSQGNEALLAIRDGNLIKIWLDGEEISAEDVLPSILLWEPGQLTIGDFPKELQAEIGEGVGLESLVLSSVAKLDESQLEQVVDFELENFLQQGGETMPGKYDKILEGLSGLEGYEGAAVVSDEGLILASHFVKKYAQDKIAALVAESLKQAKRVTSEAGWGEPDNMVIEGQTGKMVLYKAKIGFVVIFGSKDMNLGLARVTLDELTDKLDQA